MAAPLYSRYCRYAQREAKRFPRHSPIANMIPKWKRPDTTVFSLSDRAAHEAGWWSTEGPGELMRGMSLQFLPTDRVWIEWNWQSMQQGSLRYELNDPEKQVLSTSVDGIRVGDDGRAPVRVGAMICQTSGDALTASGSSSTWYDTTCPPGTFMGLLCYLYGNGSFFVGPTFSFWHGSQSLIPLSEVIKPESKEERIQMHVAALGSHYVERWDQKHPRLMDKLCLQLTMAMIGQPTGTTDFSEVQGTTRLLQASLMAAITAKPTQYDQDPNLTPKERRRRGDGKERRVVEVDLFMRERRKPGASLKASAGHMEAVRKGLHTVGAHYAYRSRDDGGDPTKCTVDPTGTHDFEEVHGTKTEVCVLCAQKRWFKQAHQRGDEAYGIVPRRVRNVRMGEAAE